MMNLLVMNGYEFHVWSSYAATFLMIATLVYLSRRKRRQVLKKLHYQRKPRWGK